ncbi:MAG: glucosamine-6-phosphate deaminase [Candidatus Latescibacteria bacterium]|nr:glucosamine-6-phosphate deaminase [Candidatus Latescibacterota bacterium]MCK5525859.1 glucosamine-6-phosphate deaminase [Candidatus Latescibacterota bacterium]MCK5733173.1 glucosamine-6-phosphate deaminase [Candidatus Latescibacterota bacterium]
MRVIIEKDYEAISGKAAEFVAEIVRNKPDCVLGLATGSTPIGLYKELIRMHKEEGLDFARVTTFNLDEYYGLTPAHDQSYHYFMHDNLFNYINVSPANINVPSGTAPDVEASCARYEEMIEEAGGIDIQVLGIGSDGHIAFNEPGSSLASSTRLVTLTEETVQDNARFFETEEEVPRFAITMGVGTILETRKCLVLASGAKKAGIIAEAVEGPITSQITASALQMHPDTVVIVDEEASTGFARRGFYTYSERILAEL